MSLYLWVKALHVMGVIAWMAGLLYLPRLFVYHTAEPVGSPTTATFEVMERRLLRGIMNPSMIIAWLAGVTMIFLNPALLSFGWLHAKLLLVVAMTGAHMYFARCRRLIADGKNPHSERFYRFANEVPALLMVGIVILVIVQPF